MALMRARHEVFGVADVPDNEVYRDNGWTEVDPSTLTRVEAERKAEGDAFIAATTYDPAAHNADEVVAHIESAPEAEAERVLEAERAGKARKSVLDAS